VSAFTNHLGLVEFDDAEGRAIPTKDGRSQWWVAGPPFLSYEVGSEGSGESITVPGREWQFHTDLGSIPRAAWSLGFPPDGIGAKAFVIHDFLCDTLGTGIWRGQKWITRSRPYTSHEAAEILHEALLVCGVDDRHAGMIRAAVLVGGPKWGD
jgi:hypothetical protein